MSTQTVTQCTKCKTIVGFSPRSKYCGDGSDKDNGHRYERVELSEEQYAQAFAAHKEKWGQHARIEEWQSAREPASG